MLKYFPNVAKEDGDDDLDDPAPPPPRGGLLGVDLLEDDEANHVDGAVRDFPDDDCGVASALLAIATVPISELS